MKRVTSVKEVDNDGGWTLGTRVKINNEQRNHFAENKGFFYQFEMIDDTNYQVKPETSYQQLVLLILNVDHMSLLIGQKMT